MHSPTTSPAMRSSGPRSHCDMDRVHQSRPHVSRHAGEWVVSYSTQIPRRFGSALVHVEQRVESLRRALAASDNRFEITVLDARTGNVVLGSRAPQQTGSELGVPGDARFRELVGATEDGVRKLGNLRAVYRHLGVAADSENDWIVVASAPRVRAASLVGVNSLPIALALLGVLLIGAAMARRWVRTSKDALTDALTGLGNRRKLVDDLSRGCWLATAERRSTSCSTTSTGSRTTTTRSVTRPGTRCSVASAPARRRRGSDGTAYRLGGDEFCVVDRSAVEGIDEIARRDDRGALRPRRGLRSTAPHGAVVLPTTRATSRVPCGRRPAALRGQAERAPLVEPPEHRRAPAGAARARPELGSTTCTTSAISPPPSARASGSRRRSSTCSASPASCTTSARSRSRTRSCPSPARSTRTEWAIVRQHTIIGERISRAAPALAQVAKLVRSSHERYDGTGYPEGIAGSEIPLGSRIVAVCDAFDAMIGPRPYRLGMTEEAALAELRGCAGTQFDPAVVEAFCACTRRVATEDQRSSSR